MTFRSLLPFSLAALIAAPAFAQFQAPQPSPGSTLTQRIGLTELALSYSRPSVKGRAIWGEVVPWDKPWRTGANQATTLIVSDDITVEGQKLTAGTYAIVTIPGKTEWTVIFNRDTKLWTGPEYDPAKDVLRVKVKPVAIPLLETLRIGFPKVEAAKGVLAIEWEKVQVPVSIGVDIDAKAHRIVAAAGPADWQTPMNAARYYFDQKRNQAEAWTWLEKSIAIQRNYVNLTRKARVLADEGKFAEAVKLGEEALALAKAAPEKPNASTLEKSLAEWKAKLK
jgi:hypothetical protein